MTENTSPVYQARYGWDRRTTGVVAASAFFTAILLLPDVPLVGRILGLPLFGGGGLFMAYMAMSRKVAFRVDETGVLLGGNPARYRATTVHVPWDDITGFVLWRQVTGSASLSYVGLVRREGAPALPGDGPKSRAVVRRLVSVPEDVAFASRAVTGWRLDKERLVTAIAHFAPGVPVRDRL
ncbi:hypothetical protein [Streptomyces colonosanans]|uniref:DUF304 domain-containing protein n=1 Tax=Streptomyces colonosanans TaxID=1428652 RepID=A0A1S2P3P1_9ACTN|nr:hypothetical protein [Streptomyces colonosanans]OIJ88298.1 hypothetical protein BIV24_22280 [Streptomyces colonosanans]